MHDAGALPALVVAGLIAGIFDVTRRRIPNWLTTGLLAGGIAYRWAEGSPLAALGGGVCGFVLLIVPWGWGWVGAGDVKLLTGLGAWLGWEGAIRAAITGCTLAAAWAGIVLWRSGRATWIWQGPYVAAIAILSRQGRGVLRDLAMADPVPTLPLGLFLSAGAVAADALRWP